jgi:H/ACA ribonucleoprotein complex subunit 4
MINLDKIRKEKPIDELLKFSIINIDKPTGPTSFQVDEKIKFQLKINKTSHFGTLDPMVTGVLPVALGRACRLNNYFMHRDKTYVGIMRIHENIEDKKLLEAISKFIGKIDQLPPVRSRVKRALRQREVKTFNIIERDGQDIVFETTVQAGTYIRKLIHDLGETIGGAHMLELRRTKAGIFEENSCVNLYDLDNAVEMLKQGDESKIRKILTPAEIVCELLPQIEINSRDSIKQLLTGKPLMKMDFKGKLPQEPFLIMNKDQIIGIYNPGSDGDIIARPEFVLN